MKKINLFNDFGTEKYQEYMELLISRVTHATMALELDLGDPNASKNAIRLRDNILAFKKLIELMEDGKELTEEIIINIANLINRSSMYISDGYRHIGKHITETDIPITEAPNISEEVNKLLYDYNHSWVHLDPYERESRFHIEFIRIHPFEDGNGRVSRLLLAFNLMSQGLAPAIITNDLIEYYHDYISNYDIKKMQNLFQIQSRQEEDIINYLLQEHLENNKHL